MADAAGTTLEISGGIATITLNEPDNRNALSASLCAGLLRDVTAANADDAAHVIVLTNTSHVFCAGADLSATSFDGRSAGESDGMVAAFEAILDSPKPVVGRIAGHCSGGGVGLAAACDISIAADDAKFGFTEVRIGMAPAIISVICLPKLSRADAAALMLRGGRHPAERAAAAGLINAAVPASELDAEVEAACADLLLGGPIALAQTKELLRNGPGVDRTSAFADMAGLSTAMFNAPEAQAGMAAYLDRKPPPWVAG